MRNGMHISSALNGPNIEKAKMTISHFGCLLQVPTFSVHSAHNNLCRTPRPTYKQLLLRKQKNSNKYELKFIQKSHTIQTHNGRSVSTTLGLAIP